jgi:uncharacterized protein YndB with AHSA1/START domain
MSTSTAHSLRLTRVIAASPQVVFEAWTRPEHLKNWSCPEGATLEDVEVDLREGGAYTLRMRNAEGQVHTARGEYRVIDPPRRLVYTWDWLEEENRMGETVVTVELEEAADGRTQVVLTHEGFPAEEAKVGHGQGWASCLDRLERLYA